jgi:hypothetical protein
MGRSPGRFVKVRAGFLKSVATPSEWTSGEEVYDGVELLVTRKGAILAGADLGIIPGSMATGTYIVRGLGNGHAYNSASHGAGRRMRGRPLCPHGTVRAHWSRLGPEGEVRG